jgi:hypothetical protein
VPSDAKYVRKIGYAAVGEVNADVVRDLMAQAVNALPRFRRHVRAG